MKKIIKISTFMVVLICAISLFNSTSYAKTTKYTYKDTGTVVISKGNKSIITCEKTKGYKLHIKYKKLVVKSSNTKVATINKYGIVTGKKTGKAKVSIYFDNKKIHTWKIKVVKKIPDAKKFDYTTKQDDNGNDYAEITKYKGYESIVNVPASINGIPVKSFVACIDQSATPVTTLNFADGIESIGTSGKSIFGIEYGYSIVANSTLLSKIKLPTTLKKLGRNVFAECNGLKKINIKEIYDTGSIPAYSFYGCLALNIDLNIPGSVTTIGEFAFNTSGIKSVKFGEGVQCIKEHAFGSVKCENTDLVIPASVVSIEKEAFAFSSFNTITIVNNNTQVDGSAFNFTKQN